MNWTRTTDDGDVQDSEDDVMFAVDTDERGGRVAVIADVSRDDAWITMSLSATQPLSQCR
ncbi:DUF7556 family protein [Halomicrococcus sp. NG-SE-24]|uniref:DUF7556 family protein n=1 Tax=Halomicrococcus sp. NG-SE-24 TaxID=3436928 RepID=UPI003D96316B